MLKEHEGIYRCTISKLVKKFKRFGTLVWVVLDVSLTVPMSFVLNTNCRCYVQLLDNLHTLHICIRTHDATF